MKKMMKSLKKTAGYSMTELILSITLVGISMIPIYQMAVGGARIQNRAEKTYQATLASQSLLQSILQQMEKDLAQAYEVSRGLLSADIKTWLEPGARQTTYLLSDFLDTKQDQAYCEDFFERLWCEIYIWDIKDQMMENKPIAVISNATANTFQPKEDNPWQMIKVDINEPIKKYFIKQEPILWPSLGVSKKPVAIGELSYIHDKALKIRGSGIKGENIQIDQIEPYKVIANKVNILCLQYMENLKGELIITNRLIIEDHISELGEEDRIALSVDLTSFPVDANPQVIRVENKTKATLTIPVYNEKDFDHIKIYPLQKNREGHIILENRDKLEPRKNFIVGIVIKDKDIILSKLVDVFSYDYNKK